MKGQPRVPLEQPTSDRGFKPSTICQDSILNKGSLLGLHSCQCLVNHSHSVATEHRTDSVADTASSAQLIEGKRPPPTTNSCHGYTHFSSLDVCHSFSQKLISGLGPWSKLLCVIIRTVKTNVLIWIHSSRSNNQHSFTQSAAAL